MEDKKGIQQSAGDGRSDLAVLFDSLDENHDGRVDRDELLRFFTRQNDGVPVLSERSLDKLLDRYVPKEKQTHRGVGWTVEEFEMVFAGALKMFHELDVGRTGFISPQEVQEALEINSLSATSNLFDVSGVVSSFDLF